MRVKDLDLSCNGMGVETQPTLLHCTAQGRAWLVAGSLRIWSPDSGFLFAVFYNIQPDISSEKLRTICEFKLDFYT